MKTPQVALAPLLIALSFVAGCGKQEEVVTAGPRFDAKAIASEADKGNLEPLKRLNEACKAEVKREGKRMAACKAQDDAGGYMKPLNIRF